ncbi:alpha/beta fold hydrolase [Psychromarinibacter sp. C21-152]|uniref:Alpha/beta fold hydrolase n=1 Tax=Psychromarinibacter sediminicola TaxID=3033385 RepID=A0AAE3NNK9_9RHOB|nr:alpha/beta fold hydrolase [Psychromarinibacter sediminicola]MDF0601293.1 alpha/beta fold hydrolase [Psychromarinibacter sediminicola]
MRRLILLCLFVTLSACAPRAKLIFAPEMAADLPTRSIFVVTTREIEGGSFGDGRSTAPLFLSYDLSIPPKREIGSVTYPGAELDPETQFLAKGRHIYPKSADFRTAVRGALREEEVREAIVYVHGFNNTFDEGVLRIAQLAQDFGIRGVPVHYSWPSAGSVFGYAYDRDSVLFSRDGMDQLISELKAAGAESIIIVAHSVGSHLVMETLRQRAIAEPGSVSRDIDGVVLISPDIDVQLFRTQAQRIDRLPDPFGIFVSKRDRALQLSARLTGQRNRLGRASAAEVSDLEVTLVDVTDFSSGAGHFTAGDSPALISLFRNAGNFEAAFRGDSAGRTGLLSGTVLTVQDATEIILSPITTLAQ